MQLVAEIDAVKAGDCNDDKCRHEAEEIADRVGVINNGELILVEEKAQLMQKLGKKQLTLQLTESLTQLPESLKAYDLELIADHQQLVYTFDTGSDRTGITALLDDLKAAGIRFSDLQTNQSTLEDIFVDLINGPAEPVEEKGKQEMESPAQ